MFNNIHSINLLKRRVIILQYATSLLMLTVIFIRQSKRTILNFSIYKQTPPFLNKDIKLAKKS